MAAAFEALGGLFRTSAPIALDSEHYPMLGPHPEERCYGVGISEGLNHAQFELIVTRKNPRPYKSKSGTD